MTTNKTLVYELDYTNASDNYDTTKRDEAIQVCCRILDTLKPHEYAYAVKILISRNEVLPIGTY